MGGRGGNFGETGGLKVAKFEENMGKVSDAEGEIKQLKMTALAFKREGKLEQALEALKKAKNLEATRGKKGLTLNLVHFVRKYQCFFFCLLYFPFF